MLVGDDHERPGISLRVMGFATVTFVERRGERLLLSFALQSPSAGKPFGWAELSECCSRAASKGCFDGYSKKPECLKTAVLDLFGSEKRRRPNSGKTVTSGHFGWVHELHEAMVA